MDKRPHRFVAVVAGIGLLLWFYVAKKFMEPPTGADEATCLIVYMWPSYARINLFDETHTQFASKYSLYLYREQGKDRVPNENGQEGLDGIPVLFIPGNAGSYRQVRSIAAEAANLYFDDGDEYRTQNLDFFAADFNEDFTAFHGRTILDQAEYLNEAIRFILGLYANQKNPPKSVILLGHSMGGVVARIMLTLPNYEPDSVNTIVTLSSPHAAAPLTFDGDILKIYSAVDRFWIAGFSNDATRLASIARQRLGRVLLISITGGASDLMLPADYTTLSYLVPPSNGFSVHTTEIPEVWTPIDHLAVVWCSQLRRRVALALLQIVYSKSPTKTISLTERMNVFRQMFLSGFENSTVVLSEKESVPEIGAESATKPKVLNGELHRISLDEASLLTVLWQHGNVELCDDRNCGIVEGNSIPNPNGKVGESSLGGPLSPYRAIVLDKDSLLLVSSAYIQAESVVVHSSHTSLTINPTLWQLVLRNHSYVFKPDLATNLHIPGAWSSLLAYRINLVFEHNSFPPFARQWSTDPYETKWHTQIQSNMPFTLYTHGIAPYTPFPIDKPRGLNVQLWLKSEQDVTVSVTVDIANSAKLLVLRYRLAVVGMGLFVALLVLLVQFKWYNRIGKWPDFPTAMATVAGPRGFVAVTIFFGGVSWLVSHPWVVMLLNLLDPVVLQDRNEINISLHRNFKLNSFFLGTEESFLWVLGPIFFAMAVSINLVLYYVLLKAGQITGWGVQHTSFVLSRKTTSKRTMATIGVLLVLIPLYLPYQFGYIISVLIQMLSIVKLFAAKQKDNVLNYQMAILMVMMWILPINVPTLIVFVHNVMVNWKTPFSSHHNFLAIIPILFLVERNNSRQVLPQRNFSTITYSLIGYFAFYSVVYGFRHTFWLHHLFNVLACWLIYLSY